jgi:hypothetical protein
MKKYRNYIIIGVMLTLIAIIFLFWDDIKKIFKKPKELDPSENITSNSNPINTGNQNPLPNTETKFGIWVKLNFGNTGAPILAEYNKQKITEIPNGSYVGEFLGTTPDNKYYRVDYGGAPALVEKVLTNKKPLP